MKSNDDFPKKEDVYCVELTMGEIISLAVFLGPAKAESIEEALKNPQIDAPSYVLERAERHTGNVYQQLCDLVEEEFGESSIIL